MHEVAGVLTAAHQVPFFFFFFSGRGRSLYSDAVAGSCNSFTDLHVIAGMPAVGMDALVGALKPAEASWRWQGSTLQPTRPFSGRGAAWVQTCSC